MALHLILKQPKGRNFGTQINELLQVFDGFNEADIEEPIYLDFKDIDFVYPVFILTISALVYKFRQMGYTVELINCDHAECSYYLENINFPMGLRPDQSEWETSLNYYDGKRFLPILNFSASRQEDKAITRNNVLTKLNKLIIKNLKLSVDYYNAISYLVSEITENIVEHSGEDRGWILAQYYKRKEYLDICIVDTGKSILGSYIDSNMSSIDNDTKAIQSAIGGISTKEDKGRGTGIPTSKRIIIEGLGGDFLIISGGGLLFNNKLLPLPVRWNGTILALRIPKNRQNFNIFDYV